MRTAVFVDAGWLLAAAATEVLGTPFRDDLVCDHAGLLAGLGEFVDRHAGGAPRLRTYWYDAAPGGAPSYEHDRIDALPYVKVRLGRLNRDRQQKGVDVLIYHDILTLARERAIQRAYLIAGDEDLREGVCEAQKLGIQVVLLGMPISKGHNQSARLLRECDEYQLLARELWLPHCKRRTGEESETEHEDITAVRQIGAAFASDLCAQRDRDQARELLARFPHLPKDLDAALLSTAEETLGSLRGKPDLKTELRARFWFALKQQLQVNQAVQALDQTPTPGG